MTLICSLLPSKTSNNFSSSPQQGKASVFLLSITPVRGEKAKNKDLWPNLNRDTSPDAILSTLKNKVDEGRNLYIETDEGDKSFFDPVKDKYTTHFLVEYNDLWDENSEWYAENNNLNNRAAVEFDGYMRISIDIEVFLRGKKQLETFNDLMSDCRDGLNTCSTNTFSGYIIHGC
ncbi:hypothetical protein Droror1_Dr00025198 [Drosera rotundifolia]